MSQFNFNILDFQFECNHLSPFPDTHQVFLVVPVRIQGQVPVAVFYLFPSDSVTSGTNNTVDEAINYKMSKVD